MSFNQSYNGVKWKAEACWAHEHSNWFSSSFLKGHSHYWLKFMFYETNYPTGVFPKWEESATKFFLEEWKQLFRDTFEFEHVKEPLGRVVICRLDHHKYACPANMYGMMGALRYIEEFPNALKTYRKYRERYPKKLNPFQILYLTEFHADDYRAYGGHDYISNELLREGEYCLKYFQDANAHVDRFLGPVLEKPKHSYSPAPMTETIFPRMGYRGPNFIQTDSFSKFTSLIPFLGTKT